MPWLKVTDSEIVQIARRRFRLRTWENFKEEVEFSQRGGELLQDADVSFDFRGKRSLAHHDLFEVVTVYGDSEVRFFHLAPFDVGEGGVGSGFFQSFESFVCHHRCLRSIAIPGESLRGDCSPPTESWTTRIPDWRLGVSTTWPHWERFSVEHYLRLEEQFDFNLNSWRVLSSLRLRYQLGCTYRLAKPRPTRPDSPWAIVGMAEGFLTLAGKEGIQQEQARVTVGVQHDPGNNHSLRFECSWQQETVFFRVNEPVNEFVFRVKWFL